MSDPPFTTLVYSAGWCWRCRMIRACAVIIATTDWHTTPIGVCRACGGAIPEPTVRQRDAVPPSADRDVPMLDFTDVAQEHSEPPAVGSLP